jgi:hypothetical protein
VDDNSAERSHCAKHPDDSGVAAMGCSISDDELGAFAWIARSFLPGIARRVCRQGDD